MSNDIGILSASTAFGKTVVATHVIGARKTNTLILVHTVALIDQWKERLEQFLEIPPGSIGQLGGGKKKLTGLIDIATIQSLGRKGAVSELISEYNPDGKLMDPAHITDKMREPDAVLGRFDSKGKFHPAKYEGKNIVFEADGF